MNTKKKCLIVGASGGIGSAITKKLAEQNFNLFLIGKNENKLLKLKKEVENEKIDVTLPIRPYQKGKVHPVSQVIDEISSIFFYYYLCNVH